MLQSVEGTGIKFKIEFNYNLQKMLIHYSNKRYKHMARAAKNTKKL